MAAGKTAKEERAGPRARVMVRGGEGAARKGVRDLSAGFSFAARREPVTSNPCDRAAVRKTDNKRERFLSLEEVRRLGRALCEIKSETITPDAVARRRLSRSPASTREPLPSRDFGL